MILIQVTVDVYYCDMFLRFITVLAFCSMHMFSRVYKRLEKLEYYYR